MVAAVFSFLAWSWVLIRPRYFCRHLVTSDAAGATSFGAYSQDQWFYGAWSMVQARQSMAYQELFPVVIAAHLWGSLWARKHVPFHLNNNAVIAILMTRTSKVPALMHLLHVVRSFAFGGALGFYFHCCSCSWS